MCRRCYRNHKYCSVICKKEGRKRSQRISKRKYEKSDEAKADHRDRQQNYRDRIREFLNGERRSVTEHSIGPLNLSVETAPEIKLIRNTDRCRGCGVDRYAFIGSSL